MQELKFFEKETGYGAKYKNGTEYVKGMIAMAASAVLKLRKPRSVNIVARSGFITSERGLITFPKL